MTPPPSLARRVWQALPRRSEFGRFAAAVSSPATSSSIRGITDGLRVSYVLRTSGVRSLLPPRPEWPGAVDVARAVCVAQAVDAGLGLLPISATCLRRSVTLLRELDRLGLAGELHIGVRRGPSSIEAHAWVQVEDVVINDERTLTDTYVEIAAGELERVLPSLK